MACPVPHLTGHFREEGCKVSGTKEMAKSSDLRVEGRSKRVGNRHMRVKAPWGCLVRTLSQCEENRRSCCFSLFQRTSAAAVHTIII